MFAWFLHVPHLLGINLAFEVVNLSFQAADFLFEPFRVSSAMSNTPDFRCGRRWTRCIAEHPAQRPAGLGTRRAPERLNASPIRYSDWLAPALGCKPPSFLQLLVAGGIAYA